jgi:hypothetical protein
VDDEQGPWWTRPPEPDPRAARADGTYPPPAAYLPDAPRGTSDPYPPVDPHDPLASAEPAVVVPMRPKLRRVGVAQPPPSPDQTAMDQTALDQTALDQARPEQAAPNQPNPLNQAASDQATSYLAAPADRTESLHPVEDDIFATFSGPIPLVGASPGANGPSTTDGGPVDPLDPWQEEQPRRLPPLKMPEGRVLLLAGAGGLVVLLIVLVALISGSGGGEKPSDPGAVAARSTVNPAPVLPGKEPAGLKKLTDSEATALLQKAGETSAGTIVEAWSWKDDNGQNLVVTSTTPARGGKQTLRVTHVAKLDGNPKTLRVMRDPNLPADCKGAGTASFTKNSLLVRDLNRDGTAEVTAGWSSRCGDKGTDSEVKLALITDGDKYIIRGNGVIGKAGSGDTSPDPRAAKWPKNYLKPLTKMFHQLYY